MFSINSPLWNIRVRKLLVLALVLPIFTIISAVAPQQAFAATIAAADGSCIQTVGSTAEVTVTRLGNDCIVQFTSTTSTKWTAPSGISTVRHLIVGAGASGDRGVCAVYWGHGGGGGQVKDAILSVIPLTEYTVTVGVGGAGSANGVCPTDAPTIPDAGFSGTQSQFATVTAAGGIRAVTKSAVGGTSGSGFVGGTGTGPYPAGGGGGAGGVGSDINGGIGLNSNISGSEIMYGSGGAGRNDAGFGSASSGGGARSLLPTANRGGGGSDISPGWSGGANGVVILRYTDRFVITFDTNGAISGAPTSSLITQISKDATITLASRGTLVKGNLTFAGWNTQSDGRGTNYLANSTYTPTRDITLYAQWNSIINYDSNSSTSTRAIESTTATNNAAATTLSNGKLVLLAPVASGLLFNLNAADQTSIASNTWSDVNRNGITGTIVGSPTYNSEEGYIQLNGTSQYINLGSSVMPAGGTSTFTASVMFKSDMPSEDNDAIMSRYHATNGGPFIIRNYSHGKIQAFRTGADVVATTLYNAGEVNQATLTYNGTAATLYLNGVKQGSSVTQGAASTAIGDLILGALGFQSSSIANYWAGRIYSAQGYSRALTDAEVLQNYQALLPGQKVTKTNFTLAPWNTDSYGTGTAIGSTATDLDALPTPYLRLKPANYTPGNSAATRWTATNGSGAAFTYTGTPAYNATGGGNFGASAYFPTVSGTTSDGIRLNNPSLKTYTLCAVARYKWANGTISGTKRRIFGSVSTNWISGFYNGLVNQFHHDAFTYQGTTTDNNWHYFCDSANRSYWDGAKNASTNVTNTTLAANMAINWEYIGETSDWELADFVIYDQYLSDTQIEKVNRYFKNTYGIYNGSTLTQAAVSASPSTTYASTGDTTLFANWGSAITYDGNKQTSGTAPAPTFITGTSGALASNSGSLARAGWRFDGWNTAADGSGTNYAAGGAYANLGNVLLYAKWTLVTAFPSGIVNNDPTTLNPYMRFKASDYDTVGKTWKDSSGNGRNTSLVAGTPTLSTVAANLNGSTKSFQVVSGTAATESIRFGMTANLTNWTIFNVARYNGAAKQRILASEDGNALYGFWNGKSGVAYHNGWITQFANTVHGDNWVLSTNYYSNYRSNGISRTLYAGGDTALRPIAINHYSGEKSDFQVAEILVFDYKLTDAQILKVEDYLAATYGISNYTPANTYPTSSSFAFATTVGGRTDTFTAAYGLGTKSFSISPAISGITIDTSTANGVAVVVSSLVPTGTYSATLTATDQSGATATHLLNLTVAPPVKFDTSTATTIITTHRRGATLQLNTIGGTGTKVFTMTSAGTGITLDTTTAASGYATLRVDTYTAIGTYTQIIAVTDDTKVRSTFTVTIVINAPPTLASTSVITTAPVLSDLKLNLDAGDTASYAGSGTTWTDLSGNGKSATWQTTAPFSKDFGGSFTHARATNQYASTATLGATDVFSVEVWVKFKTLNVNLNYPCLVSDAYLNTLINYSICFRGNNVLMGGYHRSGWTLTSGFTPVAGTWYQFVYTVSKSGSNYISTLFQNGNMVGTPTTATMIPGNSGGSTFIGRRWDGEDYIDGSMPVVRIYNRALSTSEITQNYNALLPRFANNPTNSVTITTTESVTASSSIYYAGLGTGNKTFALSNSTTGISIDTATVNTVKLNVASTVSATSSTVARTISQIISATDSTGLAAATPVYVTTVINPKVLISASTATTLSTTYGVAAYDTFTATYGTGASTFSGVSSSYQSGFVVSNPSSNVGLLTVASNLPAGTYYETITATDSVGASTIYLLTVIINPPLAIAGSPSNSVSTTVGKATSLQINITNGTGSKNLTFTSPVTGITLDTTTVSSGYATVNLSSATPVGSFTFSLYAVDSSKYTTSISITATVNRWPVIGTPSIISSGLKISLDAGNSSSYSGSGKTWSDLSGNGKTGTWQQTPNFSSNSGGTIAMGSTTTQYMAAAGLGATNVFTAEAWVKFTSIPTQDNCILSDKYNASYINFSICFRNDSKVSGGYWNASNGWIISAGTSVTTNTWYHFAYTVSLAGSTYTSLLYLNSSQVGAAVTSTVAPSSGSTGFLVGTNWRADTTVVSGDIAIVRVYSKALSKNEVVQNYNAQGLRFTATNSGTDTATVTQGTAGSVLNVAATEGTGTKTFAITDLNSGVSLDNSVANSYTLNLASTLTATSTTVAKTITETVTATDSMAATTTRVYTITINPPIKVESTTATVTTTSGIAAWDTFTATFGTGNKIFSLTGSPSTSGFTLTQSANQAVLKVEPTANPGTYLETITATDTLGATKSVMVTIIVAPGPIILGANTLVAAKTIAFRSPTYSVASGIAPFTYSLTSTAVSPSSNPTSGITFDATTMTLRVSATVLSGTYVETLTVTDSKGATSRFSISLTVKDPVSLTGSLDIVKTYGDLSVNAYTINNGVSAYGFRTTVGSTSDVCVPITGAVDANTYEMITSIGACNWIAPTGVSAADYVVAAGGGGGGSGRAGGGGGGGVATGTGLTLTGGSTYGITIGSGGAAATSATLGSQGGDSWIGTTDGATKYVSAGGGGGGGTLSLSAAIGNGATGNNAPSATVKSAGGAGGGGGLNFATGSPTTNYYRQGGASGAGTEASYSGGNSYRCDSDAAKADGQKSVNAGRTTGGGGGAGGTGIGFTTGAICPTFTVTPPNGGAAVSTTLTGSTLYFGGGGGGSDGRFIGGVEYEYGSSGRGTGTNGGGNGQQVDVPTSASNATLVLSALPASSGTDNTGGGGGGGISSAGSGGSGALIMRYATPTRVTNAISLATVSNGSSSTAGSVVLTIPENVTAGSTTKSIKVTDLNGSTVYTVNITINQATPVVTISLPGSVATGKYGTAVTLSAVVSTDGIVEFKDAATVISGCSAVASSSGIATCSWIPSVLGSRSITATLTPTDSVNYLPSISTYSVSIGKADTLTVTASSENFTYSESPALITKPFTYSGLASIDTLTSVEMIYTGIANDSTIINSSSGPTPAGTYVITPNASTAGISLISGNYSSVSLVPGTLTISRAVPTTVFAYPNSNVTTYSIDGTLSSVTTSSSGSGIKSYSTTTPTICSIESSTALVSILKAGSCLVSMDVTESANYLAKSQPTTITIEKAARTITLTSPVGTLKYYETTTATAVISDGSSDGTLTYSLNATPGCSFDPLSGIITATSGTLACTLNSTVAEGENYLLAATTSPLALTIAKADAPGIVINPVSAVDHLPNTRAQISPTYSISGLKGSDSASQLTLTYGFVSNPFEAFIYSDTLTPIDAGTYSITPSNLVMSSGLLTNYETPNYSGSTINFIVNQIAQAPVTIDNFNGEITVPFYLLVSGGSNPSATPEFNKISGTTCTLTDNRIDATSSGQCQVTVTIPANRNYLAVTSDTATILIRNYQIVPVFNFGNGSSGIPLSTKTPLTIGVISCVTGCAPTITSASPDSARVGDVIILTGTNFTGVIRIVFNIFIDAIMFNADSDTQITVQIPEGVIPTDMDGIDVITPGGTSMRFYDFTILP